MGEGTLEHLKGLQSLQELGPFKVRTHKYLVFSSSRPMEELLLSSLDLVGAMRLVLANGP